MYVQARIYTIGRWKRGEIGDGARDAYLYTLTSLCEVHGKRPVNQLGPAIIDRWLETIAHRAPATRRIRLSHVRQFCRWLLAQGKIRKDPTAHVPSIRQPRRVPQTLTRPQVQDLLRALPDLRARVIVAVMDDVGARCVEVARLRVEDYDPHGRTLHLTGKGMHERNVPITPATARIIDAYLDEIGTVGGPLIRSRMDPSTGLDARTISAYVRRWMWDAGVKHRALDGRSAHGLRRTCLSELMESCGDVQVVQAVAGHQHPSTTIQSYLRPVSEARMRAAMDARAAA